MNQQNNILVATDGSQASKQAFFQALQFFENQEIFSQLIVSHISDPLKTELPFEFQSQNIYETYKIELLSRYPTHKYQLLFEERKPNDENIRNILLRTAEDCHAGYIFLGYHGRKGPKLDVTILGQTVRYCINQCKIPLIMSKYLYERNPEQKRGFNFLVCIDGSNKSLKCLNVAIQLAFDQYDKIICCFAPTPDNINYSSSLKIKVTESMKDAQRNWEYICLEPSFNDAQTIINYINFNPKISIDFFVFGANGQRSELQNISFFGNFAEKLLTSAHANPILVT